MEVIATIGFFDGVHTGHRFVLQQLRAQADVRGMQSLVITFRQHPRSILSEEPQLLTTPDERQALLQAQGIHSVEMLDFTTIQQMTAREFMLLLHQAYNVRCLLLGYDHRFGSDQLTDFSSYQAIGEDVGITILPLSEYQCLGEHVSSTAIRKALLAGEIEVANRLLGYSYTLQGTVIAGRQIGREIGFPTANIQLSSDKLIPKHGVWVADVQGEGEDTTLRKGLLSIGSNPTVGGEGIHVEVHILDYTGDLYGKRLQLHLVRYLREERKFDSLQSLQAQIEQDKKEALR